MVARKKNKYIHSHSHQNQIWMDPIVQSRLTAAHLEPKNHQATQQISNFCGIFCTNFARMFFDKINHSKKPVPTLLKSINFLCNSQIYNYIL